ncbi:MAG: WbqC family protein [Paludibacteraceae bacterium]|nr:WbqC family protein [Paludibacteraceae bacterium]
MAERTYTLEQTRYERKTMTLPTAYWGPASYFDLLLDTQTEGQKDDGIQIEVMESFEKQTFRNRCLIHDMQGREIRLTVPLQKVEHKQLTRDIEICYRSHWQHQHWLALRSAYEHTPYFLYFADLIRPWYERQTRFLIDLNDGLTQLAAAIIQRRIEADGQIHNKLVLRRTEQWQQSNQNNWQNEPSILDRLMREGA